MGFFSFSKTKTQAANSPGYTGIPIQSSAYGKVIPVLYGTTRISGNLLWYGDFVQTATQSTAGSGGGKGGGVGGGGGKGGGGSVTYTYSTALALSLCEGPIVGFGNVYVDKNVTTLAGLGFSEFTGTYPQTAWTYLTSKHPSEALGYNGIAYVANGSLQLGSSPNLSNYNFEVLGRFANSIAGQVDADPSMVLTDILTNNKYGVGFPSANIGDLTDWQDYCIALGMWVSPSYTEAEQSANIIAALAAGTNSAFFWSGGKLNIYPYGDTTVTGNGHTFTPNTTPLFNLTDDDFLDNEGGSRNDPVSVTRTRPADAFNQLQLEYLDRAKNYNTAIAEAKDQNAIDLYGLRSMGNVDAHIFADGAAARMSAQLQLQRQSVRNIYQWTTDLRYIVLDPMDIVTLEDDSLGPDPIPVRITQIEMTQGGDGTLTLNFTAEEYLGGVGDSPAYSFQQGDGFEVNYNEDPGDVNTPVIFEPPVQINDTGTLEVWFGLSGVDVAKWGGCQVWISSDGTNYALAGTVIGAARQGVLSATLPTGSDPDTSNTLSVNLTMSGAALLSGTKADADANHTLCYVGGELISYQTATLTAPNEYNLTYLRRGQFGTTISAHASGSDFLRIDNGIFVYTYDKSIIGQTVFAKFLSFNKYQGGIQSLSDVDPYEYTLQGPPLPGQVQNFSASQKGNVVVFDWTELSTDSGLKGYDIAYGAVGAPWNQMQLLTEAARATEMTNAAVPPGTWDFVIRGHDIADNLGAESRISAFVVVNENPVITEDPQAPGWAGDLFNCIRHHTGVLIPQGQYPTTFYRYLAAPGAPTLGQTPGGSAGATTYYVSVTFADGSGETTLGTEATLAVSANNLLTVTVPALPASAEGCNIYVGTSSGTKTRQTSGIAGGSTWSMPLTGLVAGATPPTSNTTGHQTFDEVLADPVDTFHYTTPTIDTGFNDTLRIFASSTFGLAYGQTLSPTVGLQIDTWLTGDPDPNVFTPWTIGDEYLHYLRARQIVTGVTQGNIPYMTQFTPITDKAPVIENTLGVVIAPGGTTVFFPVAFHFPPFVQATVISSSALYATVSNVTDTSCEINVWNSSNVSVGGTVNITATGE